MILKLVKIDSSPLIYAIKANYFDKLKLIYDQVIIVDSVYEEVVIQGKKRKKPDALRIDYLIKNNELIRHSDEKIKTPRFNLGKGEIAVIHAADIENCEALIDDQKARKTSLINGIQTTWTFMIFLRLLKKKKITEKEFDSLVTEYCNIASPSIIEIQMVQEIKELIK